MARYVISKDNKYIEWARIHSSEGRVWISDAGFTNNLMEARIFSTYEKNEDTLAWEQYLKLKHGEGFEYKEVEFIVKK